jgi:glycosyltransferase involved in cell wall biosynthesis
MKKNIYFFHWPSNLGGADTRLKDLIQLFNWSNNYNIFCIPNDNERLKEAHVVSFLKENNVKILTWENLPSKTEGFAIAFCNFKLFEEKWRLQKIKDIGLKFIWSNDMMWSTKEEVEAFSLDLVKYTIFTSEFHQKKLVKINNNFSKTRQFIIPNYFNFEQYENLNKEKKQSLKDKFVIGKLSRAEWTKYSENFPLFYKHIPIKNTHFRFMGWNDKLKNKYSWFKFDEKFELLPADSENILEFLSQLDLYVFTCHHNYIENQSRAIIEAQLMGIPCIVPNEGNFPNMIWHGRNGYLYNNNEECYKYILNLYEDKDLLKLMKKNSRKLTKLIWCDKNTQIAYWEKIFNYE